MEVNPKGNNNLQCVKKSEFFKCKFEMSPFK